MVQVGEARVAAIWRHVKIQAPGNICILLGFAAIYYNKASCCLGGGGVGEEGWGRSTHISP